MTRASFRAEHQPVFVHQAGPGAWTLDVRVQPGASRDEATGLHGDRIKIRLRAKALENKANKALVVFVAKLLGLRKSQVSIMAGHTCRDKSLRIESEKGVAWTALVREY